MLRFSRMLEPGTQMPAFELPGTDGLTWRASDFVGGQASVIAFICNHCPFVLHVVDTFAALAREYQARGVSFVAISSNDPTEFPEDDFPHMVKFAEDHGFIFPYLFDETQDVALAFNAICTPDFFVFDREAALYYTGQLDASRPNTGHPPLPGTPRLRTDLPVTGEDLRGALDALLAGDPSPKDAKPSAGCSIKWRPGKAPSWA